MIRINDKSEVSDMVKSYCNLNDYDEELTENIMKQLQEYLDKIEYNFNNTLKKINLIYLKFDNLFCFGTRNFVDFTKLHNITGLIGDNGSGKSSLINAILFSIFDKFYKGDKWGAINTLTNHDGFSEIKLQVNNDFFIIKRTFIFGKKKTYDVEIYKNDELIDLEKNKANNYIYQNICTYEDFIYSSVILQKSGNFINYRDSDKKKFIETIFNLDIIKIINDDIKKDKKQIIAKLKVKKQDKDKLEENDIENNHKKYRKKLKTNNGNISEIEKEISDLSKKLEKIKLDGEFNTKIISQIKKHLSFDLLKLKEDLDKFNNIEKTYGAFVSEKKKEKNRLLEIKEQYLKSLYQVDNVDCSLKESIEHDLKNLVIHKVPDNVLSNYQLYLESKKKRKTLSNNLVNANNKLKNTLDDYNKIKDHQVNDQCQACITNILTINKRKLEFELILDEININSNKIKLDLEECNKICNSSYLEDYEKFMENKGTEKRIKRLKKQLSEISKCIHNNKVNDKIKIINKKLKKNKLKKLENYDKYLELKDKLEDYEKTDMKLKSIKNYEKYVSLINNYDNLDTCIIENQKLESLLTNKKIEFKKLLKEKDILKENLFKYKHKLEQLSDLKEEIADLEYDKVLIDQINLIFNKDQFIDFYLNNNVLPSITRKANEILKTFSNLQINQKTLNEKFIIEKIENGLAINSSSFCGFEDFMVNLCIRMAINILNKKTRTNFLIIDEGFGVCDETNVQKLNELFDIIKNDYSWCLIISHLENVKNKFDNTFVIDSDNIVIN